MNRKINNNKSMIRNDDKYSKNTRTKLKFNFCKE